ncbi:hypothetical protein MMYC01_205619 [Madurella mycetomatis]|uniref:Uncharacterized protein n=1 Tax=Madurella mycetomatis TaxID=100816 RepID=A0A175W638_9PEZI|nr:hypothetical protein MMYC01_205619 [Madurella mycetomatis]
MEMGAAPALDSFDMLGSIGRISTTDLGPISGIEQWLVGSPQALDMSTNLDMDMCLWPNDVVDPAALSFATTTPSRMTPPLSTPTSSNPPAEDGLRSSPVDDQSSPSASGRSSTLARASAMGSPVPCDCLHRVVFLLDELESIRDMEPAQLEAGLTSHRRALGYGEAMMACGHCTSRPENMTILTFLADRLIGLWEHISNNYLELLPGGIPPPAAAGPVGMMDAANRWLNPAAGTNDVLFGDYGDSASEWKSSVGNLIALQLQALSLLMGRVREVASVIQCDTPSRKAAGAQKRVAVLLDRLNSMTAWDV